MTGSGARHAERFVEARLGREPQDMLEAAVVLEAWAGVPAGEALRSGRAIMASSAPEARASAGRLPGTENARGTAVEALSFVIAVVAIAAWAAPLSSRVGREVLEEALIVALPTTLALQWGLASRYLSRPEGLARLGRRPLLLLFAAAALVVIPALAVGRAGALAGLLTLTWTGGTIVIRRRWSLLYAGMVVLATVAMVAGLPGTNVLGFTAAVTAVAVAAAVRARVVPTGHAPGRWGRAVVAAAIGAGLGLVLVTDRSVDWSVGSIPAVGLLPSSIASFWAGARLWRFQRVIPQTLSGVAVADGDVRGLGAAPLRVLLDAVVRLVALTVLLSLVLVAVAEALGARTSGITVLAGFGLVALATLLVGLLEAIGRGTWALVALGGGVAAEVAALSFTELSSVTGGGLMIGASIAVIVALPMVVSGLSRPAATLATALGIR
ncbi:MAG: hypothetical protein QOF04_2599 [Solirubrobacteraceae bacterium]|nr:hypothetical protein [Solirubrobacteraceae bacterium]